MDGSKRLIDLEKETLEGISMKFKKIGIIFVSIVALLVVVGTVQTFQENIRETEEAAEMAALAEREAQAQEQEQQRQEELAQFPEMFYNSDSIWQIDIIEWDGTEETKYIQPYTNENGQRMCRIAFAKDTYSLSIEDQQIHFNGGVVWGETMNAMTFQNFDIENDNPKQYSATYLKITGGEQTDSEYDYEPSWDWDTMELQITLTELNDSVENAADKIKIAEYLFTHYQLDLGDVRLSSYPEKDVNEVYSTIAEGLPQLESSWPIIIEKADRYIRDRDNIIYRYHSSFALVPFSKNNIVSIFGISDQGQISVDYIFSPYVVCYLTEPVGFDNQHRSVTNTHVVVGQNNYGNTGFYVTGDEVYGSDVTFEPYYAYSGMERSELDKIADEGKYYIVVYPMFSGELSKGSIKILESVNGEIQEVYNKRIPKEDTTNNIICQVGP